MILRYIDGPEVRFKENDKIFIDMEFYHTGEVFKSLEARRMFPITGKNKYIALLDGDGEEQAMIRDIESLDIESKNVIKNCLEEYYMMPRIIRFIDMSEKFKIWMWTAETDKGIVKFEIRNHITAVKPLFDNRVLIKDANDNRYEVPDWTKLDKKSRKLLLPNL